MPVMWRQTSKNVTGGAAATPETTEPTALFALQHTGQPTPPDVLEALRVVVKSGLLKKVDAPLLSSEHHTPGVEDFHMRLTRMMQCLEELDGKASPPQQAKLVYIAHTLLDMETYFLARPTENATLIGMLKALRPECDNPPNVSNGMDTTQYSAMSHMKEIKACFQQQLQASNVKSNTVRNKFTFPVFKLNKFTFVEPGSVQLFDEALRKEGCEGWDEKVDKFHKNFSKMVDIINKQIKEQEGGGGEQDPPEPNGTQPDGHKPRPESPKTPEPQPDDSSSHEQMQPDINKPLQQRAVYTPGAPPRASVMKLTVPSQVSASW